MKIAMGIAVVTLTLAIAADVATTRQVDASGQSAAWTSRVQGKSPGDFTPGTTTRLEYHDKLVRQQARENKINALNRRCEGDNSALCRKHNDSPGGEAPRRPE
jgi:hypothetical protein